MNLLKLLRVQLLHQLGDGRANEVLGAGRLNAGVLVVSAKKEHLLHVHLVRDVAQVGAHPAQRFAARRRGAEPLQSCQQMGVVGGRRAVGQKAANALQALGQARGLEWFQNIVNGFSFKGLNRKFIKSGDEDHARCAFDALRHFQPCEAGHADVQKSQVRHQLGNALGCLNAIARHMHDVQLGPQLLQLGHQRPGQMGFVVGNERGGHGADDDKGKRKVARVPSPRPCACTCACTSSVAALP